MAIGFGSSSLINNSNETLGYESLPLSRIHLMRDRAPRFLHVAREEEASRDYVCSIVNRRLRCLHASTKVNHVHLISDVINL